MPDDPTLTFHDDPVEFLAVAGDHLAADPVVSTVVATIAERAAARTPPASRIEVPHRWWVVARDDAGHVTGTGMRTAPFSPYPLFVLPMPDDAALALARALHERGEVVGGVNGALPAAEVVRRRSSPGGRAASVDVQMHTRLHRLDDGRPAATGGGAAASRPSRTRWTWRSTGTPRSPRCRRAGRPGAGQPCTTMGETRGGDGSGGSTTSGSGSGWTTTTAPCTSPASIRRPSAPPGSGRSTPRASTADAGTPPTPWPRSRSGSSTPATCPASTPTRPTRRPTSSTPPSATGRSSTWSNLLVG